MLFETLMHKSLSQTLWGFSKTWDRIQKLEKKGGVSPGTFWSLTRCLGREPGGGEGSAVGAQVAGSVDSGSRSPWGPCSCSSE